MTTTYTVTFVSDLDTDEVRKALQGREDFSDLQVKAKGSRPTGVKTARVFELLQTRPLMTRAQIADQAGCSISRVAEIINQSKMTWTLEQQTIVEGYLQAQDQEKARKATEAVKAQVSKVLEAPPAPEKPKPAARKKAAPKA